MPNNVSNLLTGFESFSSFLQPCLNSTKDAKDTNIGNICAESASIGDAHTGSVYTKSACLEGICTRNVFVGNACIEGINTKSTYIKSIFFDV